MYHGFMSDCAYTESYVCHDLYRKLLARYGYCEFTDDFSAAYKNDDIEIRTGSCVIADREKVVGEFNCSDLGRKYVAAFVIEKGCDRKIIIWRQSILRAFYQMLVEMLSTEYLNHRVDISCLAKIAMEANETK